nr:hypothetical protein [Vulgatibacter incomptus]
MDAVGLHRVAKSLRARGVPFAPDVLRYAIRLLYSSVVPIETEIGEGTHLGYGGLGVVIHPAARIGARCLIGPHVTIGGRSGYTGAPRIGDEVLIAVGARVLGPIVIGDGAIVGANAVVVRDVPPGVVVGGVPARILGPAGRSREAFRAEMKAHFGVELVDAGAHR